MEKTKLIKVLTFCLISLLSLAISLPGSFSSGPIWPDGQRYTFNGILLHDMVRDKAIFHPYDYNVRFYAKYPATSLPYGSPFFALVFAAAFSLFGISFSVARWVVAIYTMGAALMLWHLIYHINRSYWHAVLAVSAFLFNPLTGIYSRDITPELALAFYSFLTIFFFYNYVEYEKKYFGIYAALAFSLGYLTKPYIIPLGMALVLYAIIRRKLYIMYKRESLLALVITAGLIVPSTMLAFKYATNELGGTTIPSIDVNLLLAYPTIAIKCLPILTAGAIIGFIIGLLRKDNLTLLCLLWTFSCYFFFTFYLPEHQDQKYFFTFLPALIVPFVMTIDRLYFLLKKFRLNIVLIMLLIVFFAHGTLSSGVSYIRGYEEAGKYVAEHPHGKSVLFYGRYDGTFMMGIRRVIPKGGPYVLRGDRQLAVRVSYGKAKQSVSVESSDDIIKLLNRYRTGYVAIEIESTLERDFPEYNILMQTISSNTELFTEVAKFPIQTNWNTLVSNELVIYKFSFDKSTNPAKKLKIPVPTLKKELEVVF
ncbi:MAG: ArnT family glycosyltransferase [Desulfobacterales bacterium]